MSVFALKDRHTVRNRNINASINHYTYYTPLPGVVGVVTISKFYFLWRCKLTYLLEHLKPLTTDQYDKCRESAMARVSKRIGNRPVWQQFQRELVSLITPLDIIAILVFISAFMVSSIHIISHMGKLASASYNTVSQPVAGSVFSRDLYVALHQWMLIPLAEGSMILFLVMFGMSDKNWRKWVYFALAAVAVAFVLVANIQSGIGWLESLMPPIFTIGIGLKLEQLIVQSLRRREGVNQRYIEALEAWEVASQDATKHPDFLAILRQEIWQKLITLKSNMEFMDAPSPFKRDAVQRELERERWTYEDQGSVLFTHQVLPGEASTRLPFGNIRPIPAEDVYIQTTQNANGHTAYANE